MYAVIEISGSFSGVTYSEMTDAINKYHAQYGQTLLEVDMAPQDTVPPSPDPDAVHEPDYGVPTQEQLRVGMNWKHREYLDSTDWYVLRKVETDEAIPAEVLTKRAEARVALGR